MRAGPARRSPSSLVRTGFRVRLPGWPPPTSGLRRWKVLRCLPQRRARRHIATQASCFATPEGASVPQFNDRRIRRSASRAVEAAKAARAPLRSLPRSITSNDSVEPGARSTLTSVRAHQRRSSGQSRSKRTRAGSCRAPPWKGTTICTRSHGVTRPRRPSAVTP